MSKRSHSRLAQKQRTDFYLEGKAFDADEDTRHLANCWLCQGRIDYEVDPGTTDDSHNLDHYFPVDDYPDLQDDPTNFRHSHRICNQRRGKDAPSAGLGEMVPDWWG